MTLRRHIGCRNFSRYTSGVTYRQCKIRHGPDATYFDVRMLRAYRVFAKRSASGEVRVALAESKLARRLEADWAATVHAAGQLVFCAPNCVFARINFGRGRNYSIVELEMTSSPQIGAQFPDISSTSTYRIHNVSVIEPNHIRMTSQQQNVFRCHSILVGSRA